MNINDIYETNIIRFNNEGDGIASINNLLVFVKEALPKEKVKIKITDIKDNYALGEVIEVLSKSSDRVNPICPYYEVCGGCNTMHMNYNLELEFKKEKVKSIFKKISNIDINIKEIISDIEYNYRNKVTLKVSNDNIGFYKEKTNEIINIDKCFLVNNLINQEIPKLKSFIYKHKDNNINEIMIRVISNKIMFSLDNINELIKDEFINTFNYINSIYINNELCLGEKYLEKEIDDLKFNISPKSFFQVNDYILSKMYEKAVSYIEPSDLTLDLYSGTGTITSLVSKKSKNVIGIEVVKDAVNDANNNIRKNNINNIKFICDKVENKIDELRNENIDNIILDPPRSGSDKKSLKAILDINPKRIIYISCNPVTLARDYNLLKENYTIKEITLFDMFPKTYHIESLMVLERK